MTVSLNMSERAVNRPETPFSPKARKNPKALTFDILWQNHDPVNESVNIPDLIASSFNKLYFLPIIALSMFLIASYRV
jgi:hypothetical protein